MRILKDLADFRNFRREIPRQKRVGFVPTMGALHAGHGSLVKASVRDNDITLVSIFVNPTQFGPNEDFDAYPRTLEKDAELLAEIGVDAIFAPNKSHIYPEHAQYFSVNIHSLADRLCGKSRPGHMEGVVQVVSILFHIVQPDRAYFGLKDYQQFLILQKMAQAFHFPVEVKGCPIIRETDGLAMSSRNMYLDSEQREQAIFLYRTLCYVRDHLVNFPSLDAIHSWVEGELKKYPLVNLDYFEVLDGHSLEEINDLNSTKNLHAFVAAYVGKSRLIDNMRLN